MKTNHEIGTCEIDLTYEALIEAGLSAKPRSLASNNSFCGRIFMYCRTPLAKEKALE